MAPMVAEEQNTIPIYILLDLLEEILILLPLKSILKYRTVSKHWRSILESRKFAEKRKSLQNTRKILAAYNCDCGGRPSLLPDSRFEGDEEIVYLHCNTTQPSISFDGLVCFPQKDWIIVLNPSTRQIRRFPSGLNLHDKTRFGFGLWSRFSPWSWAMGFGRDKVTGKYKVVRMCFSLRELGRNDRIVECCLLDVETGEWRKLSPSRHKVNAGSKSVCVNGSIYWLHIGRGNYGIIALDLHTEEFHRVQSSRGLVTRLSQIANLEDRLVIATANFAPQWKLDIWSMDTETEENGWINTYSINLLHTVEPWRRMGMWFKPVSVSKQGNLVFHDNEKRLFKYYPKAGETRCLSLDPCVISPYTENLVSFPLKPSHPHTYTDFKKRINK